MDVYKFDELAEAAVKGWPAIEHEVCTVHDCDEDVCNCPMIQPCFERCHAPLPD